MDIVLSNSSDKPIYEQITGQIKEAILTGKLVSGDAMPSIRALANDLHVSVITTKRAYTDLEAEGFIDTVPGKGSFVTGGSIEMFKEEHLRRIEDHLGRAIEESRIAGVNLKELHSMLDILAEE